MKKFENLKKLSRRMILLDTVPYTAWPITPYVNIAVVKSISTISYHGVT